MNQTLPSFSKGEKKKIRRVLDLHRLRIRETMNTSTSPYNNELGCGNCGDLGPTYKTLHALEVLFKLSKV